MSDYIVDLSPALVNLGSEGSLDTSKNAQGDSVQRTMHGIMIVNNGERKMVGKLKDGDTFTNNIESVGDYPNIVVL